MIQELIKNKIYLYASFIKNGVRQVSFYIDKPRETYKNILIPFRAVINEIYFSNSPEYVEEIKTLMTTKFPLTDNFTLEKNDDYGKFGAITCLICPVAERIPEIFVNYMYKISNGLLNKNAESIRSVIVESITSMNKLNPAIKPHTNILDASLITSTASVK